VNPRRKRQPQRDRHDRDRRCEHQNGDPPAETIQQHGRERQKHRARKSRDAREHEERGGTLPLDRKPVDDSAKGGLVQRQGLRDAERGEHKQERDLVPDGGERAEREGADDRSRDQQRSRTCTVQRAPHPGCEQARDE
jgi:hypothetical protein